jgi:hypothetical protein
MMDGMDNCTPQMPGSHSTKVALADAIDELAGSGYTLLRAVFGRDEIQKLADGLSAALCDRNEESVLRSRGRLYGSRNLIETFPEVCTIPRHPVLQEFVTAVLGPTAGMVRALYFDKPPDRSWSLPWHRDRTIAVKRNDVLTDRFRKPNEVFQFHANQSRPTTSIPLRTQEGRSRRRIIINAERTGTMISTRLSTKRPVMPQERGGCLGGFAYEQANIAPAHPLQL